MFFLTLPIEHCTWETLVQIINIGRLLAAFLMKYFCDAWPATKKALRSPYARTDSATELISQYLCIPTHCEQVVFELGRHTHLLNM